MNKTPCQALTCDLGGMELSEKAKNLFLKKIGQNIERLIYEKFKSKKRFLAETGFHKQTLHDITTGARDAHVLTLKTIAAHLGVSVRELMPED
jgi:DNA-binding Xre family transcriptional regulator